MKSQNAQKTSPSIFTALVVASLVGSAMLPLPGMAGTVNETVTVTPGQTVTEAEARDLSRQAAHVVRRLADARTAINNSDFDGARAALADAQTLLQTIRDDMPTAKVRDQISVARQHLAYDSTEEVSADLVPIMASLDEIEGVVATDGARSYVRDAGEKLQNGDKDGAGEALKQASEALVYTEVDLPVSSTLAQIQAATSALDANDPVAADAALQAAEDGMVFVSVGATSPIANAHRSLWQATKDYAAHDYDATKADLAAAGVWLDKAAESTDRVTREAAAGLKADTLALGAKLGAASDETASALSGLWARTRALSERTAERTSAAWNDAWAKSDAKLSLINAKLHLGFAQTAAFVHGTTADIKDQLDQASADLDTAAKQAKEEGNQKLAAAIADSKAEIAALRADLGDKTDAAKAHYDKAMSDLRQLIRDL